MGCGMWRLLISWCLVLLFPLSSCAIGSKPQLAEIKCCTNLEGSEWKAQSYRDEKQLAKVLSNSALSVAFGANGHLSGYAGCNRYTASYKASAGKLEIGQTASTRMFCAEPEGLMAQESSFLKAINRSATYSMNASQLELRDRHGDVLAIFERLSRP
jgi:heat shock protein HslJ